MFDGVQILSNTIQYDQTRSNSTKQGVQTVKCLFTKQCLMVFGRQTFLVCPGPKSNFFYITILTLPTIRVTYTENTITQLIVIRATYTATNITILYLRYLRNRQLLTITYNYLHYILTLRREYFSMNHPIKEKFSRLYLIISLLIRS